jgi:hypothetical protein
MTDLRQAAQQALEALEGVYLSLQLPDLLKVVGPITALRKALEQPQQEPVAWLKEDWTGGHLNYESVYEGAFAAFPVYKHSPAAQRKPLTMKEINGIAKNYALTNPTTPLHFARAIEAAHNIKEQS